MSNAELLAMLIGSGRRDITAVALAEKVLEGVGQNLKILAKQDQKVLLEIKGIGLAKSSAILAALELGK